MDKLGWQCVCNACFQRAEADDPGLSAVRLSLPSKLAPDIIAPGFKRQARAAPAEMAFANGICHRILPFMKAELTIDSSGRVVLPKALRDRLALEPGDALQLETVGDQITLRPVRPVAPLTKEQGVWVFRTGQPLSADVTDAVLTQLRDDRDRHNFTPET